MKTRIFTSIAILLLLFSNLAFTQSTDNELHAIFIQKNEYASSYPDQYRSTSDFENINISSEPSPQNEPSVAISRINTNIAVAAWRDFRLGYLEPDVVRRIGYSYTIDGGITWMESQLLPDPLPDHISQSDPVVVSDMDGNFYISSTSRQPVPNYNREMLLYKSTDNGQSFALHATAVPGSGFNGEDKEWIYVDPFENNDTYNQLMIAWRSFGPSYGIKFRKSDLGGTNWSSTVNVSDQGTGQGANLTTGTDGQVIVVWAENGIRYDISYDGGNTFGSDRTLSTYPYNQNNSFPFICTDDSDGPTRGNIYVVWADRRQGTDDIWFQRSTDGGESWMQEPKRIHGNTSNSQFWPVIRCDSDGRIFVVYYHSGITPGLIYTVLAYSDDEGDTWYEQVLSSEGFQGNSPNTNVRFGDYIELDVLDGKIIPVWTDDRTGDYNQEIYTALVDIIAGIDDPTAKYDLSISNSPNPFHEATMITFCLNHEQHIYAEILDGYGRKINELYNGRFTPGDHVITWNQQVSPGIYYIRIHTETRSLVHRMIKIR